MRRYRKYILTAVVIILGICGLSWYNMQQDLSRGGSWIKEVSRQQLDQMFAEKSDFFLYVGRPTCPDCEVFYPVLEKIVSARGQRIYYYNTEAKVSEKREMRKYVESLGIDEIPMVLRVEQGKIEAHYNGQRDQDIDDFSKEIKKGD